MLEHLFDTEQTVFYHGSSTAAGIDHILIPPSDTNVLSEVGRKKNLDKVFFTEDLGLAKIYAGRAKNVFGGEPVVYRVVAPVNPTIMNNSKGAHVWYADWAFCEKIDGVMS